MEPQRLRVAELSDGALEQVRALEAELGGAIVVAYEKEYRFAGLSGDQLRKLRALEHELGVILLAYEEA